MVMGVTCVQLVGEGDWTLIDGIYFAIITATTVSPLALSLSLAFSLCVCVFASRRNAQGLAVASNACRHPPYLQPLATLPSSHSRASPSHRPSPISFTLKPSRPTAETIKVGYGDISPSTPFGRSMACAYIPVCLAIFTTCLGTIADVYFRLMALNSDSAHLDGLVRSSSGVGRLTDGLVQALFVRVKL